MLAAIWTLIGVVIAGLVAFVVDARVGRRDLASGHELHDVRDGLRAELHDVRDGLRAELHDVRDELRTEMRTGFGDVREEIRDVREELRTGLGELHRIAEMQAEMNGQLAVLRALAHTHDAA